MFSKEAPSPKNTYYFLIILHFDNINITPTLWKEALPDIYTVDDMCNKYPALAKAYENFKTVYKLVEQDYKGKKEDLDL